MGATGETDIPSRVDTDGLPTSGEKQEGDGAWERLQGWEQGRTRDPSALQQGHEGRWDTSVRSSELPPSPSLCHPPPPLLPSTSHPL